MMDRSVSTRTLLVCAMGRLSSPKRRAVLGLGAVCLVAASPAAGQLAYFSFEGDFVTGGDQIDFNFSVPAAIPQTSGFGFRTFAHSGGTNFANQTIAAGGIDSVIVLTDSTAAIVGSDDDIDFNAGILDSQIGFTQGDTPLPNPLPAESYRLNLFEFANNDPGAWAIDLTTAATQMTLTGATAGVDGVNNTGPSTTRINSLRFGTFDDGITDNPATFNQTGTLQIAGPLVIARSGDALLNNTGLVNMTGFVQTEIRPGGILTNTGTFNGSGVKIEGRLNVAGGTFTTGNTSSLDSGVITITGGTFVHGSQFQVNGGIINLDGGAMQVASGINFTGGTFTRTAGTLGFSGSATVQIAGGAVFEWQNNDFDLDDNTGFQDYRITGTGSVFRQTTASGDSTTVIDNGNRLQIQNNGKAEAEYLFVLNGGSVSVSDGTLEVNAGNSNGFRHRVEGGTLTVGTDAVASLVSQTPAFLDIGSSGPTGGDSLVRVHSDGALTTQSIRMFSGGSGNKIDVDGGTLTQVGASTLTVGEGGGAGVVIDVEFGDFITGTGLTLVNNTGTITIDEFGLFSAKGDVQVNGFGQIRVIADRETHDGDLMVAGTLSFNGGGTLELAGGDAQINTLNLNNGSLNALRSNDENPFLGVNELLGVGAATAFPDMFVAFGLGGDLARTTAPTTTLGMNQSLTTERLHVGRSASANLVIQAGGSVEALANTQIGESFADLTGNLTVTGTGSRFDTDALTLSQGTLTVADGATLVAGGPAPAAPGAGTIQIFEDGTLNIAGGDFTANGTMTFAAGSTLHKVIADVGEPIITTNAGLTIDPAAKLKIELDPGFEVFENDAFLLISSVNTIANTFVISEGRIIGGGLYFEPFIFDSGPGQAMELIVTQALLGDTDYDGDVDDTDLGVMISNFNGPGGAGKAWETGDTDGDGDVDDTDLGVAISGFTGPLAPASVPEPASMALLTIGGFFGLNRRAARS